MKFGCIFVAKTLPLGNINLIIMKICQVMLVVLF